jgi:hypothetical protein
MLLRNTQGMIIIFSSMEFLLPLKSKLFTNEKSDNIELLIIYFYFVQPCQ